MDMQKVKQMQAWQPYPVGYYPGPYGPYPQPPYMPNQPYVYPNPQYHPNHLPQNNFPQTNNKNPLSGSGGSFGMQDPYYGQPNPFGNNPNSANQPTYPNMKGSNFGGGWSKRSRQ